MSRARSGQAGEGRPDVPENEARHDTEAEATEAHPSGGGETDTPTAEADTGVPEGGETGLAEVPEPAPTPDEVDALRRECSELRDALLRRRADFENYRKRVERDRHSAAQEALAAVFREIVGTVDNLERALAAENSGDRLREGVELTHRELVGLLESHGVVALDPAGEPFDPEVHQALLHEPVPGLAEGTVAEVFRKGYTFGSRLLRPALVKVAKGGESTGHAGDGGVH